MNVLDESAEASAVNSLQLLSSQLKKLGIRHRKFYACRHTTITELVRAGHNLKAIADYVGTSVAMIEANYCARQGLNIAQNRHSGYSNYSEKLVAGPGFESAEASAVNSLQLLSSQQINKLRKRKSA